MSTPLRLTVDPILCDAYGHCAELLPELIQLDQWGYPIIDEQAVPEHLRGNARQAVAACPRLALGLKRQRPAKGRDRLSAAHRERMMAEAVAVATMAPSALRNSPAKNATSRPRRTTRPTP